ncbi:phage portal protein [Prescottella equi]|uniref:phage portal protein n=2 Tax=Rhodococcus hoagii TaxID=43767 RepID=UPI0019E4254D|nr:phage portal protein [Prescottella equi]MBM4592346.1 phage portal protein [Prescottella equi]MBM4607745.1 phage portal protein [Prescottella equi]MBM4645600.1 phage portal protein [Prescottella equi]MBM4657378.1 phage portal protein [Prescottella equi]MBM4720243.1 phage portal protein [Prescottella equi]
MTVPVSAPALLTLDALSGAEVALMTQLSAKLAKVSLSNRLKAAYYEGEQRLRKMGFSVPPQQRDLATVVGWSGTAVDVLEERLDWQGWIETGTDFGLRSIYNANDLNVDSGLGHLDALIYGTAFVAVGRGDAGEPDPLVTVESGQTMTGLYDPRSRRLTSAVAFHANEDQQAILGATLYKPNETIRLSRLTEDRPWVVVDRDQHNLGRVLVAQILNRPRAGRREGRSEISKAVRGYTDTAVRTLLGMEVNREFYSAPQRYVLGATEDAFTDASGTPVPGWQTVMGRLLGLDRDEETGDLPQVGQFPQSQPGPYLEQVRGLAQLLAAEVAIPATYLGFSTDQAASADAIRAMESRLIKRSERRQMVFGRAWLEVARLCLLVRDRQIPADFDDVVSVKWRDPATPTRSAAADEVLKYATADVVPKHSKVLLDRAGFSPDEQRQIELDRRRLAATALLDRLPTAAGNVTDPQVVNLASRKTPEVDDGGTVPN